MPVETDIVDAKPNADASSAAVDANAAGASSASQNGTESSAEKTLLSVVEEAAAASQAASVTDGGEASASRSKIEQDKAAKAASSAHVKEVVGADGKPLPKAKVDDDGKELPPFHEHPRWKETVAERNDLRTKVQDYEKNLKPLVEQQKGIVAYCTDHSISPEQFQHALEVAALINTNPAEARKRLQPIMQQLSEYDEATLPKDLEDRVAQGLDIEVAQEIAKLRAEKKGTQFNGQVLAQRQAQMQLQSRQQAMLSWEANTMKNDPDFKPKAKADEVDGKYEFVVNTFRGLAALRPPQSPQEVVQLVQQAYNSVNNTFVSRLTPRNATGKVLSSSSSSVTAEKEPATMEEAVMAAAARHGLS